MKIQKYAYVLVLVGVLCAFYGVNKASRRRGTGTKRVTSRSQMQKIQQKQFEPRRGVRGAAPIDIVIAHKEKIWDLDGEQWEKARQIIIRGRGKVDDQELAKLLRHNFKKALTEKARTLEMELKKIREKLEKM